MEISKAEGSSTIHDGSNEPVGLRKGNHRSLLLSMGYILVVPTVINEDNTSCIQLANDPKHRERAKHINIRYHFNRSHISHGVVEIIKCATEDQLADSLTKGLTIQRGGAWSMYCNQFINKVNSRQFIFMYSKLFAQPYEPD
jgi:hypothetical protein